MKIWDISQIKEVLPKEIKKILIGSVGKPLEYFFYAVSKDLQAIAFVHDKNQVRVYQSKNNTSMVDSDIREEVL